MGEKKFHAFDKVTNIAFLSSICISRNVPLIALVFFGKLEMSSVA